MPNATRATMHQHRLLLRPLEQVARQRLEQVGPHRPKVLGHARALRSERPRVLTTDQEHGGVIRHGAKLLYAYAEEWEWYDSFYFCTVTLLTVGYGDLAPTTDISKAFTVVYILLGLSLIATCLGVIFGRLQDQMQKARDVVVIDSIDATPIKAVLSSLFFATTSTAAFAMFATHRASGSAPEVPSWDS